MGNKRIPFEAGKVYHVYTHGNAYDNIFRQVKNSYRFPEKYNLYISPFAHTFAYCLMSNHFHFLITIKQKRLLMVFFRLKYPRKSVQEIEAKISQLISRQFGNLLNTYAKYCNTKYSRKGSLFSDNIERKLIDSSGYFIKAVNYMHFNPVLNEIERYDLELEMTF
ncbi:MAG TPA: hypothetical protein PKC30_14850 [Saprospiraceae bacterium]|nr:hypothetical protein [Saprospiraceae bacterium]